MILLYDMLIELLEIIFIATWMIGVYFIIFIPFNYITSYISLGYVVFLGSAYLITAYLSSCISCGIAIYTFKYYERLRFLITNKLKNKL